jgi:hypothetical protein
MKQFIKPPATILNKVNPRKPTLAFDGSNWSKWRSAINRTLQHAFLRNKLFVGDDDLFSVMNLVQNQAVTLLMCNNLDSSLLLIVESGEVTSSKDLFCPPEVQVQEIRESTQANSGRENPQVCQRLPTSQRVLARQILWPDV